MAWTKPGRRRRNRISPRPHIRDLQNIHIWERVHSNTREFIDSIFYHHTPADEVFFGTSRRSRDQLRPATCRSALQRIPDEEIYPRFPEDNTITVAPAEVLATPLQIWEKQPALLGHDKDRAGTDITARAVLREALVMEKLTRQDQQQQQHPYIVKYHGCRVRRGLITSIVLEYLPMALSEFSFYEEFRALDKAVFFARLKSAVEYVHSLRLAHNDLNPYNIMIRRKGDGDEVEPVLIDFGSCAPFGERLQLSLGTPGWWEEEFHTSEKKHDEYSLKKIEEWLNSVDNVKEGWNFKES